jgi:hypothetical protein
LRPISAGSDDDGPSPIDSIIAGRYKIRQEIGEGEMGTVYLAEQLRPFLDVNQDTWGWGDCGRSDRAFAATALYPNPPGGRFDPRMKH